MMSRLRSAIANLFCCCRKPKNGHTSATIGRVIQPSPTMIGAPSIDDVQTTAATPDVRAPYQRRSSMSLYARRCDLLKRYYSSSDSLETDCTSPPHYTATKVDDRRKNKDHDDQDDEDDDDEEEDIDAIVEDFKIRMSKPQSRSFS